MLQLIETYEKTDIRVTVLFSIWSLIGAVIIVGVYHGLLGPLKNIDVKICISE